MGARQLRAVPSQHFSMPPSARGAWPFSAVTLAATICVATRCPCPSRAASRDQVTSRQTEGRRCRLTGPARQVQRTLPIYTHIGAFLAAPWLHCSAVAPSQRWSYDI